MARTKGMLNLSGNLEVNAGAPLDARSVVPTVADLTVASNFQYKYVGMTVVVQATGDMYILIANDVTVAANWKQVGSGGGGSSYTAGNGIDISNDEISVKAGSNLSFDSSGNLNATDTKYTAGTNVSISNQNVISATDTTYTAGTGINITNNVISATGGGGGVSYSTTEQNTGLKWTDGKPIYQKTFVDILDHGTSTTLYYKNIIPNVKHIIKHEDLGFYMYSGSQSFRAGLIPLPMIGNTGGTAASVTTTGTFIEVPSGTTSLAGLILNNAHGSAQIEFDITIWYTKTTD